MGLYHFRLRFSSCFQTLKQAFIREMGQKRGQVAVSSSVSENGRNFVSKLGAETHAPASARQNFHGNSFFCL